MAHSGTGAALTAIELGKCPVLVPGSPGTPKHIDDHQLQIAAELERRNLAVACAPEDLTRAVLASAASRSTARVDTPPPSSWPALFPPATRTTPRIRAHECTFTHRRPSSPTTTLERVWPIACSPSRSCRGPRNIEVVVADSDAEPQADAMVQAAFPAGRLPVAPAQRGLCPPCHGDLPFLRRHTCWC